MPSRNNLGCCSVEVVIYVHDPHSKIYSVKLENRLEVSILPGFFILNFRIFWKISNFGRKNDIFGEKARLICLLLVDPLIWQKHFLECTSNSSTLLHFHFINIYSTFSIFNHRVSFFNKSTCYLNEAQSPVELCWCGDSRAHFSHGAFAHYHTGFTCRCRTEARRQRVLQQLCVGGSEIVDSGLSVAITFPDSCDRTAWMKVSGNNKKLPDPLIW